MPSWLGRRKRGEWDEFLTEHQRFVRRTHQGHNLIPVHPEGVHEKIWMRITLSEQPWTGGSAPGELGNGGSGPLGRYQIGETEDYSFIPIVSADVDCPLCQDFNGDGVINMNDLADLTALWLATCL